jgi:hypothetical protein
VKKHAIVSPVLRDTASRNPFAPQIFDLEVFDRMVSFHLLPSQDILSPNFTLIVDGLFRPTPEIIVYGGEAFMGNSKGWVSATIQEGKVTNAFMKVGAEAIVFEEAEIYKKREVEESYSGTMVMPSFRLRQ